MEESDLSQRIKNNRTKLGLSQDQLATEAGLNLRTIQRIENGETVPRGDTLKRLAKALGLSPEKLLDWDLREDKNVITMLTLSQLFFLAFPLLGIVIPMLIWILQKDKVRDVDLVGKGILNFQISWALIFFPSFGIAFFFGFTHTGIGLLGDLLLRFFVILYGINILVIIGNLILHWKNREQIYLLAFRILR